MASRWYDKVITLRMPCHRARQLITDIPDKTVQTQIAARLVNFVLGRQSCLLWFPRCGHRFDGLQARSVSIFKFVDLDLSIRGDYSLWWATGIRRSIITGPPKLFVETSAWANVRACLAVYAMRQIGRVEKGQGGR